MMIFVECNTDEFLVKGIGVPYRKIRHAGNKSEVIKGVERYENAIGLIDEDPGKSQPRRLEEYILHEQKSKIRLLKKSKGHEKIIMILPDLESWLINKAKQNRLWLKEFGLPDTREALHKINPKKNRNYQRFLIRLTESNDDEINLLKKWIKEAIK